MNDFDDFHRLVVTFSTMLFASSLAKRRLYSSSPIPILNTGNQCAPFEGSSVITMRPLLLSRQAPHSSGCSFNALAMKYRIIFFICICAERKF